MSLPVLIVHNSSVTLAFSLFLCRRCFFPRQSIKINLFPPFYFIYAEFSLLYFMFGNPLLTVKEFFEHSQPVRDTQA